MVRKRLEIPLVKFLRELLSVLENANPSDKGLFQELLLIGTRYCGITAKEIAEEIPVGLPRMSRWINGEASPNHDMIRQKTLRILKEIISKKIKDRDF